MINNNTQPDTNGLKAILNHNETAQPNDDLLNSLKSEYDNKQVKLKLLFDAVFGE